MSNSISISSRNQAVDPTRLITLRMSLQQNVNDLVSVVSQIKYKMLTTSLSENSDLLALRCMALAGQVCMHM